MRFAVGPYTYTLRISDTFRDDCWALCAERARIITIASDCRGQDRLETLGHELAHAWIYATGEPKDIEGWCDLIGTVTAAMLADLIEQGGVEALEQMEPTEREAAGQAPLAKIG